MEKNISKKKTIVICSSITFYQDVVDIKNKLQLMGFDAIMPKLARLMEKANNYDWNFYKKSYLGKDESYGKGLAIKRHFEEIEKGDVLLVVNNKKHSIDGYIGPNVLMEMALAFHFGKPIFVMNPIPPTSPFIEELNAMQPIVLDGDLRKIKK